jgi:hypothetical protein
MPELAELGESELLLLRDQVGDAGRERIDAILKHRRNGGGSSVSREKRARAERSEVEVEREIISWLRFRGWSVTKNSIRAHPKGATPGTPDLYARHLPTGRRVWIEVKGPNGVISEDQMRWHAEERAIGGRVIIAYGTEDLSELEDV